MANLFRIYYYPEDITYSHPEFQKHIDKGWQKFLVDRHEVSFTKLKRLQELHERKMTGATTKTNTGEAEFTNILRGYMG